MIVVCVAATQLAQGSYQNDLATHSDEAAHFVTAMCLLDYVRSALGSNPVLYAESYYAHYPKVAFGHWPPAFFGIQAFWYWIFGGSVQAGMLLIGVIAAAAALVLFIRLRRFYGTEVAVLAVAVYLSLPLVWRSSSSLMPDTLASLFAILAVLAFCDGAVERVWQPWAAAAFWGGLAILTKESALSLLVCSPLAFIVLAGGRLRAPTMRRYFWPALCLLALPLLCIYALTGVRRVRGLLPQHMTPAAIGERLLWLSSIPELVSWPVLAIAGLGLLFARHHTRQPVDLCPWRSVMADCLSRHSGHPPQLDRRSLLPASRISHHHPLRRGPRGHIGSRRRLAAAFDNRGDAGASALFVAIVPVAVTMVCIASIPAAVVRHRSGYDRVVAAVPSGESETILVSSDPPGEGAMIVDFLVDSARPVIVLRGSKMLANSDWMGGSYRLLPATVAEVRNLLDTIPVHFIVLDANGFFDEGSRPNHRLLAQTLSDEPNQFRLIADIPLVVDRRQSQHMIQVYENLHAQGRKPEVIRIPMETSLRRTIEVNVRDWNTAGARSVPTSRLGVAIASALQPIAANLRFGRPV